jgi:hypothetical protein
LEPLLRRNSDLAGVGRMALVMPIGHVVRAVSIEPGDAPERFRPVWFVDPLLGPYRSLSAHAGVEASDHRRGYWDFSQPQVGQALAQTLENSVLPLLRAVRDLEAMVNLGALSHPSSRDGRVYGVRAAREFVLKLALGQVEVARRWAEGFRTYSYLDRQLRDEPEPNEEDRRYLDWTKRLVALLEKSDLEGMVRMLHEWEAETVRLMKLEHLWEPTPFPLELD